MSTINIKTDYSCQTEHDVYPLPEEPLPEVNKTFSFSEAKNGGKYGGKYVASTISISATSSSPLPQNSPLFLQVAGAVDWQDVAKTWDTAAVTSDKVSALAAFWGQPTLVEDETSFVTKVIVKEIAESKGSELLTLGWQYTCDINPLLGAWSLLDAKAWEPGALEKAFTEGKSLVITVFGAPDLLADKLRQSFDSEGNLLVRKPVKGADDIIKVIAKHPDTNLFISIERDEKSPGLSSLGWARLKL